MQFPSSILLSGFNRTSRIVGLHGCTLRDRFWTAASYAVLRRPARPLRPHWSVLEAVLVHWALLWVLGSVGVLCIGSASPPRNSFLHLDADTS